jgi:tetratricopeptide (TPR) repeat protein
MRLERTVTARWVAALAVGGMLVAGAAAADKKKPPAADPLRAELEGKTAAEKIDLLAAKLDAGEATKDVYFHLGNAKYEGGDVPGAAAAFEKAVAMDSTFFKAMVNLGLMYDEQQMYPKAIETFEQAAQLQPKNPDAWSHLGNTYYSQDNYAKATELYRKALQIDPDSPLALYNMAVAFADAGIFREAVKYWEHVVRVDKDGEMGKNAAENIDLVKKYLIP